MKDRNQRNYISIHTFTYTLIQDHFGDGDWAVLSS